MVTSEIFRSNDPASRTNGARARDYVGQPPSTLNVTLAGSLFILNFFLFVLVPFTASPFLFWCIATVLFVLLAPMHWGLIHDAIHRTLLKRTTVNDGIGRSLSIVYGASFDALKFGHLFHHRHNRTVLDRSEYFARSESRVKSVARYYYRLLGGLFLFEFFVCFLLLLPRRVLLPFLRSQTTDHSGFEPIASQIDRELLRDDVLPRARADSLLIITMILLTAYHYGSLWWLPLISMVLRGSVVSILDNAFHYAGPLDDLHAAYNCKLARFAARLVLNSNFHGTHHGHPKVSWRWLPKVHSLASDSSDAAKFDGPYISIVSQQFRGPILY